MEPGLSVITNLESTANNMEPTARARLLEQIQNDLKNISLETKKSKVLLPVREATEEAIVKVRQSSQAADGGREVYLSNQILYPLVQGCESKDLKLVK